MANDGTIQRPDVITDDALTWGVDYEKNVQKAVNATIKFGETAKRFSNATGEKEFNTLKKEQADTILKAAKAQEALTKEQKEQLATVAKLERAQRSANQTAASDIRLSETQRRQKEAITRVSEKEKRVVEKLNSAYAQLNRRRTEARKRVEDLNAKKALGIKLSNAEQKELKQSTKEFQKLERSIRKIDEANGKFQANVGNYPKLFKSARSALVGFVGAFGLFQGIRFFADFTRDSFRLANEAKGVQFAFDNIGQSARNAFDEVRESTRGLISDLDIKRSIVEFDNFNLSLKDSASLFEFLSLRATQTGKSIDSLRDSLVEGLSKESKLRIDNLGISVTELNEELKKAGSFTEAVANIAKREIAQAGNVLDEAANSQAQWSASVQNTSLAFGNLFTNITSGQSTVSRFIIRTLNGLESIGNKLNEFISSDEQVISKEATKNARQNFKLIENSAKELGKTLEESGQELFKGVVAKDALAEIDEFNKKIKENEKELQRIDKAIEGRGVFGFGKVEGEDTAFELAQENKALEKIIKTIEKELEITESLIQKEILRNNASKNTIAVLSDTEQKALDAKIKREKKAVFEIAKLERQVAIEKIQEQLKNEQLGIDKRLDLIAEKTGKEIAFEAFVRDETKRLRELTESETELIEKQAGENIRDIQLASIEETFNARISALKRFEEEQNRIASQQIIKVKEQAGTDPEKIKKAEEEIAKIKIDNAEKVFDKKTEYLKGILKVEGITGDQSQIIDDELTKVKLKNFDLVTQKAKEEQKKLEEIQKTQQESIKESFAGTASVIADTLNISTNNIINVFDGLTQKLEEGESKFERFGELAASTFSLIGEISGSIFQSNIDKIDAEIQANEEKFNRQLELARGNETQTALLEKEREIKRGQLEKKKRKEQEKQAKFDKGVSILNIISNTAAAIVKSVAASPLTGGLPFSAIAAAIGAAQLAVVLAQPIPKFKEGVQNFEGGAAILGDGGVPEVITDRNKKLIGVTPSKDTLYNLPKGANVYSNVGEYAKESGVMDDLMRSSILTSVQSDINKMDVSEISNAFNRNFDALEGNIKKGIDEGFKKVKFSIQNNINSESTSDYLKSGLSSWE